MSVGEMRQGHALVIGINNYGSGISSLQTAVADATAIADHLAEDHEYVVTRLLDAEASVKSIQDTLARFVETLDEESAFLLYFAGHGIARGDGNEGPKGFLLPQNAQPADVETWLSMEWLRDTLEKLSCQHLLVILDCCFAGSFRWSSTRDVMLVGQPLYDSQFERYLKGTAWQALTSASADEKAMDISPGARNTRGDATTQKHSPFAAALLKGLQGAADSSRGGHEPDGVMTATELFQYTFEELVPAGASSLQTPGIWPLKPDNQGQYVFRNPGHTRVTVPDPPLNDDNNPWQGLRAYTAGQQRLFFGRERVVTELLERVRSRPGLIAVLGASGTGKSSVVKAGLIPAIQAEESWGIVEMERLGQHPHAQLQGTVEALDKLPAQQPRMLFIDQFEELYTVSSDEEDKRGFLILLRELIDDDYTTIVLTLRSDFEPRPAASSELGDLWNRGKARYVLPAFSMEEFRSCVEGPANEKAVYFEPGSIVDELMDEVAANPGALPMLSFALAEMYRNAQKRRRETGANDRALNDADYDSIGGMIGAMHSRATALYEDADPAHRLVIQRLFLRMLSSDGGRISRRRVSPLELECAEPAEQKRVQYVLQQYIDARLLVADGESIEPAHDTLISAWGLLLDWRRNAQSQLLIRAVWQDALAWSTDRQESALLWDDHPRRLAEAESRVDELNKLETEFIKAGRRSFVIKRIRWWLIAITVIVVVGFLVKLESESSSNAEEQADERNDAETSRDKLFLNYYSNQPHIYTGRSVLGSNAGDVLEFTGDVEEDYWYPLVGGSSGVFAMGIVLPSISPDKVPYVVPAVSYSWSWVRSWATGDEGSLAQAPCLIDKELYRWEDGRVLSMGQEDSPKQALCVIDGDSYEWGDGRIVAIGHEGVLERLDTSSASRFIEHSLNWLETEPGSPIFISVGHQEQLAGLPQGRLSAQEGEDRPSTVALLNREQSCVQKEEWGKKSIFGWPGIQRSLGPTDPLFAGSALHKKLWDWGYCEIYAISDLTLLDTGRAPDIPQGVLIVANPWKLDAPQQKSIREWVIDDDNGLLIAGSGKKWTEANSSDYSSYPINQLMQLFNLQWKGQAAQD